MYKGYTKEYQDKLITADKAALLVKNGDFVAYSDYLLFPRSFDFALSKRADELRNVIVKTYSNEPPHFIRNGTGRNHFIWLDSHYDVPTRRAHQQGLVNYIPGTYHQTEKALRMYSKIDYLVILATPADEHGYFNFGICNSTINGMIDCAKHIIVEVNSEVPIALGGAGESIHISKVDHVIESRPWALEEAFDPEPSEEGRKIAEHIIPRLENGSCLQLGIGTLPNTIGNMICESDLKDLGAHTEMLNTSYLRMYQKGIINGLKKNIDRGKMVYTFALGTQELYDFIDRNPCCAAYPSNYTNSPSVTAQNDKFVSINNALEVDLFSQVSSESIGVDHISGTGGQMDFAMGAFNSNGGQSFICLTSTFTGKDGVRYSRIKPVFDPSTIVTLPRSLVHHVVTEYGCAQLKGLSTWGRAEALINIAHPDFRDELIDAAERLKIWRYTNKKI